MRNLNHGIKSGRHINRLVDGSLRPRLTAAAGVNGLIFDDS